MEGWKDGKGKWFSDIPIFQVSIIPISWLFFAFISAVKNF
jgi:hypothetical protein